MMRISSYALTAALLTPSASAQTCEGVISSFTGECTPQNFKDNLDANCSLDQLWPDGEHDAQITELCEEDAITQFVEIQGTYQLDRRYFNGGGPLVDGGKWSLDSAQVERFEANLGSGTVIGFPEYAARTQYNANNGLGTNGYPANMNLEASCDLNTVMCCFTDDGTDEGFDGFVANGDATTDVCHHDLANSPETNYIYKGWSHMADAETATHCVGFTWTSDDDELLGNMMYDVSLRNTIKKGYTEGIPGAPMCGCVEHMPVVEKASCRTATKNGETTYTFRVKEGYVSASNTADITYSDCGDLAEEAASKGNDVSAHIVGPGNGGCAQEVVDYLNEEQFVQQKTSTRYLFPDPSRWSDLVVGEGANFQPPKLDPFEADADFRALMNAGCKKADGTPRFCIVRRICGSCGADSHRDVYYQRLTPVDDIPSDFLLKLFTDEWVRNDREDPGVVFNDMAAGDFALYSTYADALDGTNAWEWCDYGGYDGYGFPRNCGPRGPVYNEWNSYIRRTRGNANHHGFYVELP